VSDNFKLELQVDFERSVSRVEIDDVSVAACRLIRIPAGLIVAARNRALGRIGDIGSPGGWMSLMPSTGTAVP